MISQNSSARPETCVSTEASLLQGTVPVAWLRGPTLRQALVGLGSPAQEPAPPLGSVATDRHCAPSWPGAPVSLSITQWLHGTSVFPHQVMTASSLGSPKLQCQHPRLRREFLTHSCPGDPVHPMLQRDSSLHTQPPGTSGNVGSLYVHDCNAADSQSGKSGLPGGEGPHSVPWSCSRLQLPPTTWRKSPVALT